MTKKKLRLHQSSPAKKKLFIEGFALLRRLAQGPLSREEAEAELSIPYREWYRWLRVFRACDIPLAVDYRPRRGTVSEKTVRLWPEDWMRLIQTRRSAPPKRSTTKKPPTKKEIADAVATAVNRLLR